MVSSRLGPVAQIKAGTTQAAHRLSSTDYCAPLSLASLVVVGPTILTLMFLSTTMKLAASRGSKRAYHVQTLIGGYIRRQTKIQDYVR